MNSKTSSASMTRRNGYHKPVIAFIKKAYNRMAMMAGLKSNDEYYYGRLYQHHHKGEHRE